MGPGRLVAGSVQGPWSSDLHPMPFLYLIHPFPPGSLEVISSCHQQVLDIGTSKGNKASARIRDFSEAGWVQEGQQGPVPLCIVLLLGENWGQPGWESFHTCPCGNKFYSGLIVLWTLRREGGSYTCDTPGVSASAPGASVTIGRAAQGSHNSAVPILSGEPSLHLLMSTLSHIFGLV